MASAPHPLINGLTCAICSANGLTQCQAGPHTLLPCQHEYVAGCLIGHFEDRLATWTASNGTQPPTCPQGCLNPLKPNRTELNQHRVNERWTKDRLIVWNTTTHHHLTTESGRTPPYAADGTLIFEYRVHDMVTWNPNVAATVLALLYRCKVKTPLENASDLSTGDHISRAMSSLDQSLRVEYGARNAGCNLNTKPYTEVQAALRDLQQQRTWPQPRTLWLRRIKDSIAVAILQSPDVDLSLDIRLKCIGSLCEGDEFAALRTLGRPGVLDLVAATAAVQDLVTLLTRAERSTPLIGPMDMEPGDIQIAYHNACRMEDQTIGRKEWPLRVFAYVPFFEVGEVEAREVVERCGFSDSPVPSSSSSSSSSGTDAVDEEGGHGLRREWRERLRRFCRLLTDRIWGIPSTILILTPRTPRSLPELASLLMAIIGVSLLVADRLQRVTHW